ncbi:DUF3253 domain-containing protein [Siccirubricoccus sp. KC 17139]|uniref:DUF3253 domain-containing protein n=1 Tax=Siccirubricoccus soli TaxID=2899147 RepID=A0ABT1D4G4_9PROT|nr:DUF3253 domain-containing protein [Siccirubricoccus soli]MCO6416816.1 DUF3253 domain-containing protein [Siccirubricoccus soli]MCP2682951.1 DUF3253 domain-containing protein [Siccirubricoccus soli]
MTQPSPDAIAAEILAQTSASGPGGSISPNEVARALAGGEEATWRSLLTPVRQAALALQAAGEIEILRKGKPVPAEAVRGVIRLRRRAGA